jgi:EAL domain-containing protein (putative c-di-GMP-specific phosphodiesterase class I)
VAAEALLRWEHPERGLVMPEVIIPSAERTGQILALGEWVLREACEQLQRWRRIDPTFPGVTVNVSGYQVMGPAFARTVAAVLRDTGVDPAAVCLEVTESVFLADAGRAVAVLNEIKALGVTLALDDFGTGYSSLAYLRQLPIDTVKIDRSFTADAPGDSPTRSIVSAIIDLSHVLDRTVIAEGVETPHELTAMIELGADQAQGFHFSHPLPSDELFRYAGLRTH